MKSIIDKIIFVVKSLFYQGNFNTENMQGTGFAWLVKPELKKQGVAIPEGDNRQFSEYFNTNPSFITIVAGIFINEYKSGGNAFAAKNLYGAACGALGDSFFWHGLRPLLFLATLFICVHFSLWGVVLYPVGYILPHLILIIMGLKIGSTYGGRTISLFNRLRFNYWADMADKISIFLLGMLIVPLFRSSPADDSLFIVLFGLLFVIGYIMYKFLRPIVFLGLLIALILSTFFIYGGFVI